MAAWCLKSLRAEHLEKIEGVVDAALSEAGVKPAEIDGLAVTQGPGLVGSLLVGINYAKAFAFALHKPIVGINHIEGHVYSVAFEFPPPEYPALALVVSGGHTNLFLIPNRSVTNSSDAPAMTRQAKRSTKSPSSSASAIRAAR